MVETLIINSYSLLIYLSLLMINVMISRNSMVALLNSLKKQKAKV